MGIRRTIWRGLAVLAWAVGAGSSLAHAALYAEYRFEETSYDGTAGQVLDSSGNGRHGRTVGLASSAASGRVGRGLLIAANTTSTIAAMDTGIDINSLGDAGSITFWYKSTASGDGWKLLFDATTSSSAKFYMTREGDGGTDGLEVGMAFGSSLEKVYDAGGIDDTQWKHVAVTWAKDSGMTVYVKNTSCTTDHTESTSGSGALNANIGTLYVGDNRTSAVDGETHSSLESANGTFDLVRLFSHRLTATDVTTDCGNTAALHHMEVTAVSNTSASGASVTFTIKACANAACSSLYTGGVTGSLSVAGAGVAVNYDTGASFTIAAGSSSTTETATLTGAGTVTVGLTSLSPTATGSPGVYCGLGVAASSGASCGHTVTVALHHMELTASSGTAVTCTPITYTVKACANADCSSTYTGGMTGTLSVGGVTVNYPSGAGFTMANGSATTTVVAHATTTGTATASLTSLSIAPSNTPQVFCGMGAAASSGGSCGISMVDAALLFDVSHHVAEVSQTVSVSAVRSSNNATVCTPAFASVSRNVTFKCTYSNPTTVSPTAPKPVRVADATTNVYYALNAGNSTSAACDASGKSLALNFNASGMATAKFMYADVGQMGLTATYTGSAGTNDTGLTMTGSDSFIAAPASFSISGVTAAPIKAGESFSATVTALNSAGAAATNFGRETSAETVRLTHSKYRPSGGVAGIFTGTGASPAAALGGFSAGAATASNLQWSEVGRLDLTATLTSASYLGSGLSATGTTGSAGAVGPIVPHHFDVAVTQACGGFTYSGQPFGVTVTARNAANATTQNYAGSGTIVDAPLLSLYPQGVSLSAVNNAGTGALTSGTVSATSFVAGVATVSATPVFTFTNKQTVPTSVSIRATDGLYSAVTSSGYSEGSVVLRSGRLKMSNAFGSEKRSLSLPIQAQYWSSNKAWVVNGADSCTTVPAAAVATSNYRNSLGVAATGWSTTGSAVSISGGNGSLTMSAPSPTTTGSLEVALNLGSTAADNACLGTHPASTGANLGWLRGLNGNCVASHDRDPSARITFGIYSPENRRTIHLRELH